MAANAGAQVGNGVVTLEGTVGVRNQGAFVPVEGVEVRDLSTGNAVITDVDGNWLLLGPSGVREIYYHGPDLVPKVLTINAIEQPSHMQTILAKVGGMASQPIGVGGGTATFQSAAGYKVEVVVPPGTWPGSLRIECTFVPSFGTSLVADGYDQFANKPTYSDATFTTSHQIALRLIDLGGNDVTDLVTFNNPVTLRMEVREDVAQLIADGWIQDQTYAYMIQTLDESQGTWGETENPATLDTTTGLVETTVDHFSEWRTTIRRDAWYCWCEWTITGKCKSTGTVVAEADIDANGKVEGDISGGYSQGEEVSLSADVSISSKVGDAVSANASNVKHSGGSFQTTTKGSASWHDGNDTGCPGGKARIVICYEEITIEKECWGFCPFDWQGTVTLTVPVSATADTTCNPADCCD